MRLLIALIFSFICFSYSYAQQKPQYTQYISNTFILNPAVAGIENYTDVKISYRRQWTGIDGAPVTTYLTIQGPLHKSDEKRENPTSHHPTGENPRGKQYWDDYTATDPHAGVGLTILNDKTGPLNHFSATATYAYHLPLSQRLSMSAGIAAGVQNIHLNTNTLYFGQNSGIDPSISLNGVIQTWKPEINAGICLYSANLFAGIAVQNIVPEKIKFSGDTLKKTHGKLIPHLFVTAGYRLLINDDINFLPSVLLKYLQPEVASIDVNVKFQYRDFIWVGASYRHHDGYAALIGLNINNAFNIGYSYNQSSSGLKSATKGSHEVLVGFMLGNNYGDWCPRNVW